MPVTIYRTTINTALKVKSLYWEKYCQRGDIFGCNAIVYREWVFECI